MPVVAVRNVDEGWAKSEAAAARSGRRLQSSGSIAWLHYQQTKHSGNSLLQSSKGMWTARHVPAAAGVLALMCVLIEEQFCVTWLCMY